MRNLQNVLRDLARVRFGVRIWVTVRFKLEICKLRMRDIELAQRILQIAQIEIISCP